MIKDKSIFIKNIYYMLSYAFTTLTPTQDDEIAAEEFDNIHNLFAAILAKGIGQQLKQGLYREYLNRKEDMPVMRGKIDMPGTIKNKLARKQVLTCEYDELSENNLLNQILKTTVMLLIRHAKVDAEYKSDLKKEMLFFSAVDAIDPASIKWTTIRFQRSNQSYRMLISLAVFGDVVDSYTMKESSDDGITVRIAYEPRLARVILSDEQAKEIQKYYDRCAEQGSTQEQIEESQRAMAQMRAILGHPDRLKKLAADIVLHYEALCAEKPEIVQKAMIVCSDRAVAFRLLQEILAVRPEWGEKHRAEDESALTEEQLDKLMPLPKINLVATQGANDEKDLFDACGTKEYRKMLDRQFKNNNSNFKIAVVVDMWITGFDVPSLAVMYIDKPLQKHTLIQTISRVNRVFDGKDKGLVVDYIGIKNDMLEAVKKYGSAQESPVDELNITLGIFRNHLAMIDELLVGFNATKFYVGEPLERLTCLNMAAEYVQSNKEMETRFMGLSRRLKSAYTICFPSGELTDLETAKAQFYLAIRSIIYKQTKGDAPDAEIMNRVVEEMVRNAIACTGIENIVDENKSVDLFSDEFIAELDAVKMPITKFNALLKLLRKAISSYGRTNKVKAQEFDERLRSVVEAYNSRDKLVFTSEVVADFVNDLSDQLLQILKDLQEDKTSFEKLGISFEEKAFYDILVKVRDDHGFPYADEKCLILAKKIKELVDDKAQFADWSTRDDIKNQLNMELTVLLYQNGYPPEWDEEVFEKVMEQAENFKKYSDK